LKVLVWVKPAGVFCSLSIVIERLKSEGVVDVFQTIMVQEKD